MKTLANAAYPKRFPSYWFSVSVEDTSRGSQLWWPSKRRARTFMISDALSAKWFLASTNWSGKDNFIHFLVYLWVLEFSKWGWYQNAVRNEKWYVSKQSMGTAGLGACTELLHCYCAISRKPRTRSTRQAKHQPTQQLRWVQQRFITNPPSARNAPLITARGRPIPLQPLSLRKRSIYGRTK